MKKCPNCNQEVNDDDRFCAKCGTKLNVDNEPVDFTKPEPDLNPDPAARPQSMPDLPGSQPDAKTPPHFENPKAKTPPIPNDYIKLQEQSTKNMKAGFEAGWKSLLHPAPDQKQEQTYRLLLLLFALITIIGLFMPFTTYGMMGVKFVRLSLIGSVSGVLILILKLLECGFVVLNRKNTVLVFDVLSAAVLGFKCLGEFMIRNMIQIGQEAAMSQHMDPFIAKQMWNLHRPGSGFWVLILAAIVSFVIALVYVLKTDKKKRATAPEEPKPQPEPIVPAKPEPAPAPVQPDGKPATPVEASQPAHLPAQPKPAAAPVEEIEPEPKEQKPAVVSETPAANPDLEKTASVEIPSALPSNEDENKPASEPSASNSEAASDDLTKGPSSKPEDLPTNE